MILRGSYHRQPSTSLPLWQTRQSTPRSGLALFLVLLTVTLMTFMVFQFVDRIVSYASYQRTDERYQYEQMLAQTACESLLANHMNVDDALLSGSFVVFHHSNQNGRSIVNPGLADESAKLNLNILSLEKEHQLRARAMLMKLPGMTEPTADAILDWLDDDDEPRPMGAETSFYTNCNPSYRSANAPLRSLDELLLVRGVTPELLYGQTADDEEPLDLRVGEERGWNRWLTVLSVERNVTSTGQRRINLNDSNLPRLYDRLYPVIGPERARFVVALRLAGPWNQEQPLSRTASLPDDRSQAEARIRAQLQESIDEFHLSAGPGPVFRGGLDLASRPMFHIRSLLDLWGTQVRLLIEGQDEWIDSPWPNSLDGLRQLLLDDAEHISPYAEATIAGRVNVNLASIEVLLIVPGMTHDLAQAIVSRQRDAAGMQWGERMPNRRTLTWLLDEGIVNAATLRDLAPYLTCSGDVQQGFIACRLHNSPTAANYRVVIDRSRSVPVARLLHYIGVVPQRISEQLTGLSREL